MAFFYFYDMDIDVEKRKKIIESEAIGFERVIFRLCPDDSERKIALLALRQALTYAKSSTEKWLKEKVSENERKN